MECSESSRKPNCLQAQVRLLVQGQLLPCWGKCGLIRAAANLGVSYSPLGPAGPMLLSSRGVGGVGGKVGTLWHDSSPGLGAASDSRAHAEGVI